MDDEVHVLNSLKRLFRKEDFTILTANGGKEGLSILEKQTVQLVVSDHRMPEMTGVEFLQRVKEQYPNTIRIVLSGYADAGAILGSINKGEVYRFLTKPWNDDDLKLTLRQCLEQYDLLEQNRNLLDQVQELRGTMGQSKPVQQTLDKLWKPLMVVSDEGIIFLANEAMRQSSPSLSRIGLGRNIRETLPVPIIEAIRHNFNHDTGEEIVSIELEGQPVSFRLESIMKGAPVTGCILTRDDDGKDPD